MELFKCFSAKNKKEVEEKKRATVPIAARKHSTASSSTHAARRDSEALSESNRGGEDGSSTQVQNSGSTGGGPRVH